MMTEIYGTGIVKIQSEDIVDNTGTSGSTGGEIQRNITEIMKSVLNTIGGSVVFIEYNPAYIQNQMVSGYSNFENKMIKKDFYQVLAEIRQYQLILRRLLEEIPERIHRLKPAAVLSELSMRASCYASDITKAG